jgi:hypothetical protein
MYVFTHAYAGEAKSCAPEYRTTLEQVTTKRMQHA